MSGHTLASEANGSPPNIFHYKILEKLVKAVWDRIYEQQGNEANAIENYEKFLSLWKNADPGLP